MANIVIREGDKANSEASLWKDPFGASQVPVELNPVTMARFTPARTKQCARKSTGTHSRLWTPKPKP
jgi:hypothetical protein